VFVLLVANVVHGLLALVWIAGVQRLLAPRSAIWATSTLALGLAVPVLAGLWGLLSPALGAELSELTLLRVGPALEAAVVAAPPLAPLAWTLLGGTVILFVTQELLRAVLGVRHWQRAERLPDPALAALAERLVAEFRRQGLYGRRQRAPGVAALDLDRPVALLAGLHAPTVLVSRGLVARLDADQLEGVLAHELAHAALGGNRRLLLLWLLRALQAHSPAALVLFRSLTARLELACDALAAQVTGKPAALASALMVVHRSLPDAAAAAGPNAARATAARADRKLVETRVRALLDARPDTATPGPAAVLFGAVLLALLLGGVR
jgi:Zn-dependent protease with chaperone function